MANRYWVGGTGTWNTSSTTNWSASSGGASGASVPTAADSVFFDQAGTYTVTMTGALLCLDITVSAGVVTFATGTTPTLAVTGSMSLLAGTVWSSTGAITFNATTTGKTVTTNSVTISAPISFAGVGGGWSLGSALSTSATQSVTLTSGALALNGFNLTTGQFSSSGSGSRSVAFGSNNINLVHTTAGTTVLSMPVAGSFTWTGTGGFTADASITRSYSFGSTSGATATNAPNLSITSGAAIPSFTTNSWFNNLDFTGSSTTPAVATLNISGNLTLSTGGTYTNLSITAVGTGTITPNGKTIAVFTVNNTTGTVTLAAALSVSSFSQTSGTINFATFNMTCSSTAFYNGGTLNNIGTITCTTFTVGATFSFSSGTITPSTSFVINTGGTFTYGGTATISAVAIFTQTSGNVTLNKSYALTTAGVYTLTAGTLSLSNYTLTTGAFISTGTGTRAIDFSTSSLIQLTGNNTTIWDGGGAGFTISGTMQVTSTYGGATGTRTINAGTGWAEANTFDIKVGAAVGISINSGATDIVTIAGNVKTVDFTGLTCTITSSAAGMTVYGDFTIPATGGTFSASVQTLATFNSTSATARTITFGRTVDFPIGFNGPGGTFNLGANLTNGTTRTITFTAGTLVLNGYNISTGSFSSSNSNTRTLNFGSNSITVSGTGTVWDTTTVTNLTVSGTPIVNVTNATATATTVISGPCTEAQSISYNFTAGTYALTFLATAGHTARSVNFTGYAGTMGATAACTLYGGLTLSTGMTFNSSGGVLTFGATSGTYSINSNGKTMTPIAINGVGGTFNLGSALTSSGAIQVLAGTFDTTVTNYAVTCTALDSTTTTSARAISLNGSTVTVSGTAGVTLNMTNLTFSAGTSQLTISNATSTVLSVVGTTTFRNVSFTGGAPVVTLSGTNTYNNLTFTTGASAPSVVSITGNQTVSGTLSSSSTNASTRLQLQSSITGTQIILSAGAVSLTDVDFKDIDAAGTIPFTGTRLGDLGNNTDITFDAGKTVYWNLLAGGNWNAVAWATSSGGTVDVNNFPLPQDTCVISNTGLNTSATITINANWALGTLNMSGRTNAMTLAIGTTAPILTGSFNSTQFPSITGTGTINFNGAGNTQTITYPTTTFNPNISINNPGGTVQLGNTLTLSGTSSFTLTRGTFSCNGATLTTGIFSSNNTNTRAITFGTANIVLAHTTAGTTVLDMANASGFTCTGTGYFSTSMSVTRTFNCGATTSTSSPPSLTFVSGTSIPTITTGSYFNNLFFSDSSTPAAAVVNLYGLLTLSSTGTYTSLGVTMLGTGTITPNGKTIAAFTINTSGTITLAAAFGCTSYTQTAGTFNLATFNLTDTGTATFTAGTLNNIGTITCTTWTTQGTFAHSTGTITPSTSFVITSGSYTQTGTSVLSSVPTFTQTAGNVTFRSTYSLTATGTYTLTAGTLTLGGDLTTGIFSSTGTGVRSIVFSTYTIFLAHTTAAQVVLGMDTLTNFTYTGSGQFSSAMSVTRTFQSGQTAGATSTNVPSLALTSGASIPTLTTGGSFKNLNFTGSTCAPASTSISIYGDLTLASGGTYSTFTAIMLGSAGNVNGGGSSSLLGLNINNSGGTTTLTAALTLLATGVTTLTSGNLNLGGFNLTTGTFSSNNTNVRSITFGTGNIILATTTAAAVNLAMADATNFTYTSSGTYGSGTGCFQATMSTTRTFQFGSTAGGSATNAPRLYLASGVSVATLTTGGWFAELDFGTTGYTSAATNLNLRSLKSDLSTSALTSVTATMVGSGSIRTNTSIGPLVIGTAGSTTTLAGTTSCTTVTWTAGTLDLSGQTLNCTTFTLNGPTFSLTSGTLNPSTSFVLTSGSFTYGGTATLGATTTFTHTAGSATFNKSYALNAASTYTLSSGTLTLGTSVILSTGIFSSNNTATRSIAFGASISSGSVSLNGTTQYLTASAADNGPLDLSTATSWTVEGWFYATSLAGNGSIFWKGGGAGLNPSYALWLNTTTPQWIVGDGAAGGISQNLSAITTHTWYHFALVRNGGLVTAYINGVGSTPIAITSMGPTSSSTLWVGNAVDTRLFPGLISNLRVTKGVAVYTGDFAVPTSPLTSTQSSGTNISAITGSQTSLLLNTVSGSGFLTDSSSFGTTVTNVGTSISSPSNPFAGNIKLTHTTAATVVLSMADVTNFSYTGTGGFTVADMGNTRTFTYGTTSGSATTAVDLTFTTGASSIAITNGSWFNTLDYGVTTSTSTGTTISIVESLFLNGTYTAMTFSMLSTGYLSGGASSSVLGITINTTGTITLSGNLTTLATGTVTLTQGSLVLNGYTLTVGRFISDGTGFTRSINFGSTNIVLATTAAGATNLAMADATGFSWTGTGGFAANMSATRTFQYGSTAGGSLSNAINLSLNGGVSIPTITTGGWYKNLDFTGNSSTPAATTLNIVGNLTLSTGGTFTSVSATMLGTSTITPNGKTIAAFVVNTSSTITLAAAFGSTTYTQTAGTMDFASFNMTCTSTATYTGGTLSNIGTLACTTFTLNGPTFTFSSGTINPSVSFVVTTGSFTYNSPATLGATPLFTQTAGNVTLNKAYSLTATGTYTLTSGALSLGANLTTGIFNSSSQLFRSIAFSTYNIVLSHTTAAQTVLAMQDIVNFSYTGTGTFTSAMSVTRTFSTGIRMGIPGSMTFNGTTSSLLYATSPGFAYSTATDFTWEAWIYTASNTTGGTLFDNRNTNTDLTGVSAYVFGGQASWYNLGLNAGAGGTFGNTAANSIPNNTWTHIVFQRRTISSVPTFEIYINGSLASTYTGTIDCGASSQRFWVGRDSPLTNGYFAGNITNVRVVRGTAVYSGTYTPSTIPLSTAQSSGTNIAALDGFNTYVMLNAARGSPTTESTTVGTGPTVVNVVTNSSSPFVDSYYGQFPNLTITSGVSVASFATSSLFNTLDFTGSTTAASGIVAINNLTLDPGATYTSLSVICVGTGSIIQNNRTLSSFEVKNGYTGGTVTIVTNPLATGSYTQTSGTIDFSSLTLTVSGTYTYVAGTQLNVGTISCATLAVQGTYNFSSGTVNPSTSIVVTTPGAFTYSGTATLGATPLITHTSGSVTFNKAYALTATGTYTLTAGTLTLGADLTTGIFSSTGTGVRSIVFSTYSIVLAHTTAATVVLSMADATNFTWTGTGKFSAAMSVTRTFTVGTTSGIVATTPPNLSITSGASVPTLNGYFNNLDFTGSTCTCSSTVNIDGNLTLATGGTYTSFAVTYINTGTITNNGKTLNALTINAPSATITLADALTITNALTLTAGTLVAPFSMTSATFLSAGPFSRSITGSTTTYTVSGTGTTAWSFASVGSVSLNGSTQNLSAATSTLLDFGTNDFSIEAWVYLNTTGVAQSIASSYPASITGSTPGYQLLINASNFLVFDTYLSGVNQTITATNNALTSGAWTHVAIVKNSGTFNLYVNGNQCTNSSNLTQAVNHGAGAITFGRSLQTSAPNALNGYLTNIRIVSGVGAYAGTFTPSTSPLLWTQSSGGNKNAITSAQTILLLSTPFNSITTDFGAYVFTVTNTGTATASTLSPFTATSPGITFDNFTISMTGGTAKTFAGGSVAYPILNQGGAGALTISGDNTFDNLSATTKPSTFTFTAGSTQTFNAFTLSGVLGSLVTLNSSSAGSRYTFNKTGGQVSVGYLNIQDSNASGGGWYAGTTSTDVSNNLGWLFSSPGVFVGAGNFFAFF